MISTLYENIEIVDYLIKKSANLNLKDVILFLFNFVIDKRKYSVTFSFIKVNFSHC